MKTIVLFKSKCYLKPDKKEQIRQELKRHIEEGVLVLDSTFEWPEIIHLPEDCYDIDVCSLEDEDE